MCISIRWASCCHAGERAKCSNCELVKLMISFCQQNFDSYDLGIREWSWPTTGLPYSHLPAGLALYDVGELAGSAVPVSSACQEEEQLGLRAESSSERLLYVIKVYLGCSKKQELKDSELSFFRWAMKVKAFFELCGHSSCEIKEELTFFIPLLPGIMILTKWMFEEMNALIILNPLFLFNTDLALGTCLLD